MHLFCIFPFECVLPTNFNKEGKFFKYVYPPTPNPNRTLTGNIEMLTKRKKQQQKTGL